VLHHRRGGGVGARLRAGIWRAMRIVLLAFAAAGPVPPPPPPRGRDPTEQRLEARLGADEQR
jgi:hypothetical protein